MQAAASSRPHHQSLLRQVVDRNAPKWNSVEPASFASASRWSGLFCLARADWNSSQPSGSQLSTIEATWAWRSVGSCGNWRSGDGDSEPVIEAKRIAET